MPNILTRAWQRLRGQGEPAQSQRAWAAARLDRLTAGWLATTNSINHELRHDLDALRSRGRELLQNNDYAARYVQMVQDNLVGAAGVRLQVRIQDAPGKPDTLANAAVESAWREWSAACTLDGRQTLRDLCAQLVGGLPSDGEFLVQIVRGPAAGNRFGIALQTIDVDRIDTTYNTALAGGGAIINGVEVDAYRSPRAVHIFAAHPNDGERTSRQRMPLSLDDCIHGYKAQRAGQLRGVPWMAPGMLSLHHLGNFMLAAVLAAEHGANHYGFFKTPDGNAPGIGATGADGQTVVTSQPGTFDTLPAGFEFQPFDSKYPEQYFGPFVKTCLQRLASGWGVSYHALANDLEGVSFSSIRSGTIEERDRWAADQEWFINAFLEPVYRQWLLMSLTLGQITLPNGSAMPLAKLQKFSRHEWQPRRWDWVDPERDMNAKVAAVRAGLMSPQDLAASVGADFEDTLDAIAEAQRLAAAKGVALPAYALAPAVAAAAPAAGG